MVRRAIWLGMLSLAVFANGVGTPAFGKGLAPAKDWRLLLSPKQIRGQTKFEGGEAWEMGLFS
jgi:hypothetical protein